MELPERRRWGKCNELHAAFQFFGKVLIFEGVWSMKVPCHMLSHQDVINQIHISYSKRRGVNFDILMLRGKILEAADIPTFQASPQAGNFHRFEHEKSLSVDRGIFSCLQVGPEKLTNLREAWLKPQMMSVVELSGDPGASKNHEVETWIPSAKNKVFKMNYFLATQKWSYIVYPRLYFCTPFIQFLGKAFQSQFQSLFGFLDFDKMCFFFNFKHLGSTGLGVPVCLPCVLSAGFSAATSAAVISALGIQASILRKNQNQHWPKILSFQVVKNTNIELHFGWEKEYFWVLYWLI